MRRARQAAMLLAMATGLGWSGPAANAQASRTERSAKPTVEVVQAPKLERGSVTAVDGQWRYVAARR